MSRETLEMPAITPEQDIMLAHGPRDTVASRRRFAFLFLNLVTIVMLIAGMAYLLSSGGWTLTKYAMLLAYIITLPGLSIGFWNAVIGYTLLALRQSADRARTRRDPWAVHHDPTAPLTSRTAVVMAVRNEDPESAVFRLRAIYEDLQAQGFSSKFDFHFLSDTSDPDIAAKEQELIEKWRKNSAVPRRIHYRRRTDNTGYKAGNIEEFCKRTVDTYDFFITLDADSVMSGPAIVRLVRMMEANPEIGILQTLVVATPASTFFARAFQFGMRHGMRAYTKGSAWWQCDCGPYWGHNAILRMQPFHDHCTLPRLKWRGPLGGCVMSHDQVEAALMRKAGYHVRVLTDEFGSWEENPPTLPDFIRRDLRWCQGNMQYMQLLGMPGLHALSRIQLLLAILMFIGSVGWMSFIVLGLSEIMTANYDEAYPVWQGLLLLCVMMFMNLAPKFFGLLNVLGSRRESQRYGGRFAVLASGLCEFLFSLLLAPIVSVAVTIFIIGLAFGKKLEWRTQPRSNRRVSYLEAALNFLPQTLLGLGIFALLAIYAPLVLAWAAPVIAGFTLSIPFAVWTASDGMGAWSVRHNLFGVPEDQVRSGPLYRVMTYMEPHREEAADAAELQQTIY